MAAAQKSAARRSQTSAVFSNAWARSWNGRDDQAGSAACAASIARRMSAALPSGMRA